MDIKIEDSAVVVDGVRYVKEDGGVRLRPGDRVKWLEGNGTYRDGLLVLSAPEGSGVRLWDIDQLDWDYYDLDSVVPL